MGGPSPPPGEGALNFAVEILPEAEQEVQAAARWYESQRKGLGFEFLLAFDATVSRLRRLPERYEIVARRTRKTVLRRFPYLVFYVLEQNRILVTGVFHGHRDPLVWSDRVRDLAHQRLARAVA